MLLSIQLDDPTPIYLQLRNQIVQSIASGGLKPGDPLPSVRQLGTDLGINLHTVNKAYAVLKDEGFVTMIGRRGVVIANAPEHDSAFIEQLSKEIGRLYYEAKSRGINKEHFLVLCSKSVHRIDEEAHHV